MRLPTKIVIRPRQVSLVIVGLALFWLFSYWRFEKVYRVDWATFQHRHWPAWRVDQKPKTGDVINDIRRASVVKMMRYAWRSYKRYAWGDGELRPVERSGVQESIFGQLKGVSIVESLDTLYLMGLKKEFAEARRWVAENLTIENHYWPVSVFEVTIRFVGGLLSTYALTNDRLFLEKAELIASHLLPAFNTPSGIPTSRLVPTNLNTRRYWYWYTQLAEAGSQHLELTYLSYLINNTIYQDRVKRVRDTIELQQDKKRFGIYFVDVDPRSGDLSGRLTIGGGGDSFYEYLLKSWIQSGYEDKQAWRMYQETVDGMMRAGKYATDQTGKEIVLLDLNGWRLEQLTCFVGGMLALGAKESKHEKNDTVKQDFIKQQFQMAVDVTSTCREMYERSPAMLGPEVYDVGDEKLSDLRFLLRPELVESYFYLWRLTHDEKYRYWAWDVALAIEYNCRTNTGYTGLKNVYDKDSKKKRIDYQPSYFMAETLKYLYLIFADDRLLPLDKWVFNTEAHPLPIWRHNPAYC